MTAKEFCEQVKQCLCQKEDIRITNTIAFPYNYQYGFSRAEYDRFEDKIILRSGDTFEEGRDADEPSLPLSDILEQIDCEVKKNGDKTLAYEIFTRNRVEYEVPTEFIVSCKRVVPTILK